MSSGPRTPIDLAPLLELIAQLRSETGCPWDREQTPETLRPYLLEEAHEVAAALDGGDPVELRNELGDLLFQVAFLARIAEERNWFLLSEAIETVRRKMIDRHPHVFGSSGARTREEVVAGWERQKLAREPRKPLLEAALSPGLPALVAAYRLTQKAAGVGFDWPTVGAVVDKVQEELQEVRAVLGRMEAGDSRAVQELESELGDLLFAVANLARKLEIDPEGALARTLIRFRRRFEHVETQLRERGRSLTETSLAEMDALWEEAKQLERVSRQEP